MWVWGTEGGSVLVVGGPSGPPARPSYLSLRLRAPVLFGSTLQSLPTPTGSRTMWYPRIIYVTHTLAG